MSSAQEDPFLNYTVCHALVPGYTPSYGYVPSKGAGIAFVTIFSLMAIVHTGQAIWKREWWCFVFAVGAIGELIGWGARLWASICPYNDTAFLMQISTLIIAPTFFIAGIYVILKRFLDIMGHQYSPITPRLYLWIFCTCDFISLVLQAIGGGLASSGVPNNSSITGTRIMVSGVIFQLASISVFVYFFALFWLRTRAVEVPRSITILTYATIVALVAIYIRSIYRTVELLQGWSGYLITHQTYFVVLDGIMVAIAGGIYNFFNPAMLLKRGDITRGVELDDTRDVKSESNNHLTQLSNP